LPITGPLIVSFPPSTAGVKKKRPVNQNPDSFAGEIRDEALTKEEEGHG